MADFAAELDDSGAPQSTAENLDEEADGFDGEGDRSSLDDALPTANAWRDTLANQAHAQYTRYFASMNAADLSDLREVQGDSYTAHTVLSRIGPGSGLLSRLQFDRQETNS